MRETYIACKVDPNATLEEAFRVSNERISLFFKQKKRSHYILSYIGSNMHEGKLHLIYKIVKLSSQEIMEREKQEMQEAA